MKEKIKIPWMIERFFYLLKENKKRGLVVLLIIFWKTLLYIRQRRKIVLLENCMKTEAFNRKDIFAYIYRKDMWGKSKDSNLKYYSGHGSDPERTQEYIDLVNAFISRHKINSIVDCGCGDFRVASNFLVENYLGIDIVKELIENNIERFSSDNIKFLYLDIIEDEIPNADLCLIRLLLQHLSNFDIQTLLPKLSKFKYVLITDEIIKERVKKNEDKATNMLIRKHGLYLESPPFNRKIKVLNSTITDIGTFRTILLV